MSLFSWKILNYHYVHDSPGVFKGLKGHSIDQFRRQVKALAAAYRVIPAGDAWELIYSGKAEGELCSITFDDGISDIYTNVLPVLLEENVRGTFFINSEPLFDRRVLLVQKIHLLMGEIGIESFQKRFMERMSDPQLKSQVRDPDKYGIRHVYRYDPPHIAAFKELLNFRIPYKVLNPVLDDIFSEVFGAQDEVVLRLYASFKQLQEMLEAGMEIGSHFHTHSILSFLTDDEQLNEIEQSVRLMESLGVTRKLFSYPYGTRDVWDHTTLRILADKSVFAAFTMDRKMVGDADEISPLAIPRFSADDVFLDKSDSFKEHSERTCCRGTAQKGMR